MDTRKDTANAGSRSSAQPRPGHEQANEARLLIFAAQREGNRLLVSALRPFGLTPAQAEVICVLAEYEPLTVAALGNYLICEGGSPSRLVDNCVRHGWVMRAEGEDRRTVQLRLAPAGHALVPEIQKAYSAIGSMIASVVGERRLQALTDSLRLMLQGTESGAKVTQRLDASERADVSLRD
jgi:MarR family transcriptional regulator, organic hydroperoxide resistance regulator